MMSQTSEMFIALFMKGAELTLHVLRVFLKIKAMYVIIYDNINNVCFCLVMCELFSVMSALSCYGLVDKTVTFKMVLPSRSI